MRVYLYVAVGLLAAATVASALLDNWDILTGVGLGLLSVLGFEFFSDWFDRWGDRNSEETERHRQSLVKRPTQTTYYYDDEEDEAEAASEGVRRRRGGSGANA